MGNDLNVDTERKCIEDAIKDASRIASRHYQYLKEMDYQTSDCMSRYLENKNVYSFLKQAEHYDKELVEKVMEMLEERNNLIEGIEFTRKQIFEEKLGNVGKFTIMLFGRTMAGKSTTIEAFMGKNLKIHGNGTPDWTKDIVEYNWNGIRLVDTPGIEGFNELNYEIADNYMEQADMVLMVISDDHIEPNLIERLSDLMKENKPLVIILNIKAGNPKIAFKRPEKVIRMEEVEGHIKRIREYLYEDFNNNQRSFEVEHIPIFPVYVEGAFRAELQVIREDISNEDALLYKKLYDFSGIEAVKNYIIRTVTQDSTIIKTRSAYDSFIYRLEEMENLLILKCEPLSKQKQLMEKRRPQIIRDINGKINKFRGDSELIKEVFYNRIYDLDFFVEQYIENGAKGDFNKLYDDFLDWNSIRKKIREYQNDCIGEMNHYLSSFEEDLGFELKLISESRSKKYKYIHTIDSSKLKFAKTKKAFAKVLRVAGKTGGEFAPGALMMWGVYNFWNPTGWAAAAASVGILVVGGLGGHFTSKEIKKMGEKLERSGDKDIQVEKNNITKVLKKDLLENLKKLQLNNESWLVEIKQSALKRTVDSMSIAIGEAEIYIDETFYLIKALTAIRSELLIKQCDFMFENIIGKKYRDLFRIIRVARNFGSHIIIGIIPVANIIMKPLKINKNHINSLQLHFVSETISIVEFKDRSDNWGETQIIEALGVRSITEDRIRIENNTDKIVRIKACSEEELKSLHSNSKTNHHLCELFFRCKIVLEEAKV